MTRKYMAIMMIFAFFAFPGLAAAHTPLFACYDNGDGTIYCEGGFSDGSTAAGVPVVVKDGSENEIEQLKLTQNSDVEFEKPDGDYSVWFDGGEGHRIEIPGSRIFE